MPLHLQAKLLRVLQERQVERVGGVTLRPVDVRIISATHRDLMAMVRARRFREDLYYRLAVFPVTLPPLRDRPGDVALLARHFLGRYCAEEGKGPMALTVEALAALERHGFPGNVRELENLTSRAVLLATSDRIGLAELPEDILGGQADSRIGPLDEAPGDASPLDAAHPGLADPGPPAHAHRALPSAAPGPAAPSGLAAPGPAAPGRTGCEARRPPGVPAEGPTRGSSATRTLETFARWLPERLLRHALTLADGQVVRAAQALGVSRATLYRRLRGQDPASGKAARPETDPEDP
jgi:transcriptional regulator with GAF, ATPase, and Fis domain